MNDLQIHPSHKQSYFLSAVCWHVKWGAVKCLDHGVMTQTTRFCVEFSGINCVVRLLVLYDTVEIIIWFVTC